MTHIVNHKAEFLFNQIKEGHRMRFEMCFAILFMVNLLVRKGS